MEMHRVEPDLVASTGDIHRSPIRNDLDNQVSEELLASAVNHEQFPTSVDQGEPSNVPIGSSSTTGTHRVDMTSLNGLRGVASVWIALFHFILYSTHPLDFQGSSLMPLFFMLSGFTMALIYGAEKVKLEAVPPSVMCPCRTDRNLITNALNEDNEQCPTFDKSTFRRNRVARVIPMYYLTTLIAIPPWFAGYGWMSSLQGVPFALTVFSNFTLTTTLFSFILGGNFNGPAWTICTLVFFWLFLHRWLPAAQRMSDERLCQSMVQLYWLQMIVGFCILPLMVVAGFWVPFALATMNPLTRFPIFLMGLYSGMLVLRRIGNNNDHHSSNAEVSVPWPQLGCCNFGTVRITQKNIGEWRRMADHRSKWLLFVTLSVTLLDGLLKIAVSSQATLLGATWFQLLVPWWQLEVMVALTMCDTFSSVSTMAVDGVISMPIVKSVRFLRHWICQWFGTLSLTLYLVHFPLINYTCWILYGKSNWDWQDCDEDSVDCDRKRMHQRWMRRRVIPSWAIPVCFVIAVFLAWVSHVGFETPMRNLLRKPRS